MQNSTEEEKLCNCNDERKCKGSLKFIQVECLNEWLSLSKNKKCDICHYRFKFEKKFRIGAPKNIPIFYIFLFAFRWIVNTILNRLCLAYLVGRFSSIVCLDCGIGLKFVSSESLWSAMFCLILLTLINLFHTHFIKKALGIIGLLRGRIATLRALQSDAINRSESNLSLQSSVAANSTESRSEANNNSEESDSQADFDTFD